MDQARAMCSLMLAKGASHKPCLVFAQWRSGFRPPGALGQSGRALSLSASAPQINDETELEALCAEITSQHLATESPDSPSKPCCRFTYLTMTGEEVELCSRGRHVPVA